MGRVQRQHSGTAGRTENRQVGVFLASATDRRRTLIDRRLYLPTSWADDRERCRRTGIDDEVGFETKVALPKAEPNSPERAHEVAEAVARTWLGGP